MNFIKPILTSTYERAVLFIFQVSEGYAILLQDIAKHSPVLHEGVYDSESKAKEVAKAWALDLASSSAKRRWLNELSNANAAQAEDPEGRQPQDHRARLPLRT